MSLLLPPGVDGLADCPFPLHDAIISAFHWLSFEEWPIKDRPPRRIWMNGEKLKEHFDRVEAAMKRRVEHPEESEDEGLDEESMEFNAVELVNRG